MCYRTFEGKKLPDNIIFAAACNPYKLKNKKIKFDENVGIKKTKISRENQYNLLYTVFPLPDTMIEYVWDFGRLTKQDTKSYIHTMLLKAEISNIELLTDIICLTHEYYKENEDVSSVSLRDVSRFIILYDWFKKSLKDKQRIYLL